MQFEYHAGGKSASRWAQHTMQIENIKFGINILFFVLAVIGGTKLLFKGLQKDKVPLYKAGLFSIFFGTLLVVIDVIIAAIYPGKDLILEYLLFKRSVTDRGFSGNLIFCGYGLIVSGFLLIIFQTVKILFSKVLN